MVVLLNRIFVWFSAVTVLSVCVAGRIVVSKSCAAWPTLIRVGHRYHFEYVEVHRCMGYTGGYANNYRCVNTKSKNVTVSIKSLPSQSVMNHTSCAMKCACSSNGGSCPDNRFNEVYCENGKWNYHRCECDYSCTGNSKEDSGKAWLQVSLGVLVACLLGELFIVVSIACCCHLWKSKKSDPGNRSSREQISTIRHKLNSITCDNSKNETEGSMSLLHGGKGNKE